MKVMCGKGTLPWRPRASLGETQANGERVQHIEKSKKAFTNSRSQNIQCKKWLKLSFKHLFVSDLNSIPRIKDELTMGVC